MSLEQQVTALVSSANALTGAVNTKISQIDAALNESTQKIEKGQVGQVGIELLNLSSLGVNPPLVINQASFPYSREFQKSIYVTGQGDANPDGSVGGDAWVDVLEIYPSYGGVMARLEFMQAQRGLNSFIVESCILRAVKRTVEEPTFLQNRDGVTEIVNFRLLDQDRNVVVSGTAPARFVQMKVKRYYNAWLKLTFTNNL
jgi:hypothetical protein